MTQQPGTQHRPASAAATASGVADGLPDAAAVLAPLDRADLPSFLVDLSSGRIHAATAAAARFDLRPGDPAPSTIADAARRLGRRTAAGFGLARLNLPGGMTPRLFRFSPLALPEGAAVLFADPRAFAPVAPDLAPAPSTPPTVPALLRPLLAKPLRVTWEADAEGRLRTLSPLFAAALGARAAAFLGQTFAGLERDGLVRDAAPVTRAIAEGSSFTDLSVFVPGVGAEAALDLSLGAVPMLDATRRRVGMRGFGVASASAGRAPAAEPPRAEPEGDAPPPTRPDFGRNVVPLRSGALSPQESSAFREIARTLAAAIEDWPKAPVGDMDEAAEEAPDATAGAAPPDGEETELLDRLPVALLVQQEGALVHANRAFLSLTGWADLAALTAAGGLDCVLTRETGVLHARAPDGTRLPVEVRIVAAPFLGRPALIHVLRPMDAADDREARAAARRAALDMVPWPVFLLEADGTIRLANHAAAERLGFPAHDLAGEPFTTAVAPTDRAAAVAALDRVAQAAPAQEVAIALRNRAGLVLPGRAAITRAGTDDQLLCVVVGPPGADVQPAEPVGRSDVLPHLARRLRDGIAAPLAMLRRAVPAADSALAEAALAALSGTLDDLAALASSPPEPATTPCDLAGLVRDAAAALAPAALRRRIALRLDIPACLTATASAPHLAALVRRLLEQALDATPAGAAVAVSAFADAHDGIARACLQVSDGGMALDEPALAAALSPLSGSPANDRFCAAGRPLLLARLVADAESLGAGLEIRAGLDRGMIACLRLRT